MTTISEPEAMAEIRTIRNNISEELKKMTPEERIAFIKQGALDLEQDFSFKLKKQSDAVPR